MEQLRHRSKQPKLFYDELDPQAQAFWNDKFSAATSKLRRKRKNQGKRCDGDAS
jgi:hypothetical protein